MSAQTQLGALDARMNPDVDDATGDDTKLTFDPETLKQLISEKGRLFFLGLEDNDDATYPDDIDSSSMIHADEPQTFTDIIEFLPNAEKGELRYVKRFANANGTVDTEGIKERIDTDEIAIDLDEIDDAEQVKGVNDYEIIVDPRREAYEPIANELGFDIKAHWQVSTDSYTIINPQDAYWPAYSALKKNGEANEVFGWVDYSDYGGYVNIYILLGDQKITATLEEEEDDEDEEERELFEMYMGMQTGYDFSGNRALDLKLFGYDPDRDVRFYHLGEKRSRKHVGNPNDAEHELEEGRVPIHEWWEKEYENIIKWTDELARDIEEATRMTIDFTEFPFDIEHFFEYLDIPQSYIDKTDNGRGAVARAREHTSDPHIYSMWTLFYALSTTLEREFQGNSHTSAQFKVYADIATSLLRTPGAMIMRARNEHQEQLRREADESQTEMEKVISGGIDLDEVDSITEIDGVNTETDLDLVAKRKIAERKQQELFDFD